MKSFDEQVREVLDIAMRATHELAEAVEQAVIDTANAVVDTTSDLAEAARQEWEDRKYPRHMSYAQTTHADVLRIPLVPEMIYVTVEVTQAIIRFFKQ